MAVNNTTVLWSRPVNQTSATEFFTQYPQQNLLVGWYGQGLLFTIFSIIFINLAIRFDAKKAFAAASFINFILATIFVPLNLVGAPTWIISIIMLVLGALINRGGGRTGVQV